MCSKHRDAVLIPDVRDVDTCTPVKNPCVLSESLVRDGGDHTLSCRQQQVQVSHSVRAVRLVNDVSALLFSVARPRHGEPCCK